MIGIIGGGQLGKMLAQAARKLGHRSLFIEPAPAPPAGEYAEQIRAPYHDRAALRQLAERCSVITFEFENVDLEAIEQSIPADLLRPSAQAVRCGQDRLFEKQLFERVGLPVAPYLALDGDSPDAPDQLGQFMESLGAPVVLKTRRMGYDGKGQVVLRSPDEITAALQMLGNVPLFAEQFLSFSRELSILCSRAVDGGIVFYPLIQNTHRSGILRLSIAPAPNISERLTNQAQEFARKITANLGYVGSCAIELFEYRGELYGNELAPRVHNSGHWSIEGATASQFENHIRAITGSALNSPQVPEPVAMINLIGSVPDLTAVQSKVPIHPHLYGKTPRPARKLGHITLSAGTHEQLLERLCQVQQIAPELLPEIRL